MWLLHLQTLAGAPVVRIGASRLAPCDGVPPDPTVGLPRGHDSSADCAERLHRADPPRAGKAVGHCDLRPASRKPCSKQPAPLPVTSEVGSMDFSCQRESVPDSKVLKGLMLCQPLSNPSQQHGQI